MGGIVGQFFQSREARIDHLPAFCAAEHLAADDLHDLLRQQALHHAEHHVLRRVVVYRHFRFGLLAEHGGAGCGAEALRYHDGGVELAFADLVLRLRQRHLLDLQRGVPTQSGGDLAADFAIVLHRQRHADLGIVGAAGTAEQVAEKSAQQDRHDQVEQQRAAVGEVKNQILAYQCDQGGHGRFLYILVRLIAQAASGQREENILQPRSRRRKMVQPAALGNQPLQDVCRACAIEQEDVHLL